MAHAVVDALVRPVGRGGHVAETEARARGAAWADRRAGGGDDLGSGLAADGAGVGADAGRGLRRRDGHGALAPDVGVRAGGGDDLGLGLAADGAGIGHGAGVLLGRLRGHGAAVPLVAERGLAVALFARAAVSAGVEVIACLRAAGCDVLGENEGVRAGRGDDLGLGRAADGTGVRALAGGGLGRLRGHGAVVPRVRAGGGDDLGRNDIAAVGADGVDAAVDPAGGGHGGFRRAIAGVQARALAADLVALPCAVGIQRPAVDRVGVIVDGDDAGLEAVLGRAAGLDCRRCAIAAHVFERFAAGEGIVADVCYSGGQLHIRQRGAVLEAGVGDGGHAAGQRHVRQRDAAVEGGRAERRHGRGDGRLGERLAALKRALADGGHLTLIVDGQQLRAVVKAFVGHGGNGGRQGHAADTRAGVKRAAAEALQPVRQRDGGQPVARETEVADLGHALGDGHTRELGAHGDAVAADARHAFRQRDLRGGRQEEQRIVAHIRDAVLDDDLLEVANGVNLDTI